MTTAQTVFVVALGVVALLITIVGAYVLSSAFWSDRWYSPGRARAALQSGRTRPRRARRPRQP